VYDRGSPGFRGRCTAPLLVDRATRRLVCNESASLVRQFGVLDLPGANGVELRPAHLAAQIDELNDWVGGVTGNVGDPPVVAVRSVMGEVSVHSQEYGRCRDAQC
jgi:putative glutathione S-transferase